MASGRVPKTSITVFINICLYFRGFCITKHLLHLRKKCFDVFPYTSYYFITGTELFNGDALRHCLRLVQEIEMFHTFSHYGKVQASLLCS